MVLVAVREDDAFDPLGVVPQIGEVGEDEVDPGHVGVGEHDPAVDQQDAFVDLDTGAVAPDLAEATKEDDTYGVGHGEKLPGAPPAQTSAQATWSSSAVSSQCSNWMTPSSVKRWRSQPSAASSRPSLRQLGTILEKSIDWNMSRSGVCSSTLTASPTSMPMRSHTSCWRKRSRIRTAASKANSWRSRISEAESCW